MAPCFTFVCTKFSEYLFCRMANIIDYLSDGIYEEGDMDTEPPGDGIVDIPSSETEGGNLGDDEEKDSSILNSSSDSTLRQNVPSVGPGDRYTAESVPMDQTGSHTMSPVLAVCTLVSDGSHLQGCTPLRIRQ